MCSLPDREGEETALPYLTGTSVCVTPILRTVGKRGNERLLKCSNAAKRSLHVSHCSLPPPSCSLEVGGDGNVLSRNMGAGPCPPGWRSPSLHTAKTTHPTGRPQHCLSVGRPLQQGCPHPSCVLTPPCTAQVSAPHSPGELTSTVRQASKPHNGKW